LEEYWSSWFFSKVDYETHLSAGSLTFPSTSALKESFYLPVQSNSM